MDLVQEPVLVRDVLSACQGISTGTISCALDAAGDLLFDFSERLSPPQQQLIARLCEFGWLFRRAQRQVSNITAGGHVGAPGGATRHAFECAVQARLAEQYRTMALLQAQLQNPLPGPGGSGDKSAPYLTLRRLALWLAEPTQQLRQLCVMADSTDGLQGGQLLAALHVCSRHGAPGVAALANDVLQQAAEPLLAALRQWLTLGQLPTDSAEDFFIVEERGSRGAMPLTWLERFRVEQSRLPHFVSLALAADILRIGKSVAFLRECCGDSDFQAAAGHDAAWDSSIAALLEGDTLEQVVRQSSGAVDRYLLHAVRERAGVLRHCAALRQFLLADAGDFVAALLDAIGPELEGKASDTSEYSLNGGLEAAVRGSAARHQPDDVIGRLRVRLFRGGALETGWDLFGLEYDLDMPLDTALTPHAMTGFKRLSRFAWSVAGAEHTLSAAWRALGRAQRHLSAAATLQRRLGLDDSPPLAPASAALQALHAGRAAAAAFCATLQAHVHTEVLPSAWSSFKVASAQAGSLDEWVTALEAYVDGMQRRLLLAPPAVPLASRPGGGQVAQAALQGALAAAADTARLCAELEAEAEAAARGLATVARRASRRQRAGQWAITDQDADIQGLEPSRVAALAEAAAAAVASFAQAGTAVASAFNSQARTEGRVIQVFPL